MRETLNDVIDRVAANLTVVSADPGFTARLNARLDASPSVWRMNVGAAIAVASAVLVIALALPRTNREATTRILSVPEPVASVQQPHVVPELAADTPSVPKRSIAGRTARQALEETEPFSVIAPLSTPETLSVDALNVDSLTIAPVEFDALDLANLEVRELGPEQPKE